MKVAFGNSGDTLGASRRVAIMVVVASYHLGLLMLLRPSPIFRHAAPVRGHKWRVLELRLLPAPHALTSHRALSTQRRRAPMVNRPKALPPNASKPPSIRPPSHDHTELHPVPSTRTSNLATSTETVVGGGGFQERLHQSQSAYAVHGVPGSDMPLAPGIHFVDPMSQGIGAVMRTTQRAFGITNRHCIDVDAWRHLTPKELSARHISPDEVDKIDQKYACNRPPGLRF